MIVYCNSEVIYSETIFCKKKIQNNEQKVKLLTNSNNKNTNQLNEISKSLCQSHFDNNFTV